MGGCCVEFCNNSSVKGYIMKTFPRDPQRRAEWAKNVGRKNWTPTDSSLICEVHFAPEMWERRLDNKPKLKPHAIPTIFGYFIKEKIFNPELKSGVPAVKYEGNSAISSKSEPIDEDLEYKYLIPSIQLEECQEASNLNQNSTDIIHSNEFTHLNSINKRKKKSKNIIQTTARKKYKKLIKKVQNSTI